MNTTKRFIAALLLALSIPLFAGAATTIPWQITNLTDGSIFPSLVNGAKKGVLVTASSTIGDGTAIGGLTMSGNATTTLASYFGGNMGIGGRPSPAANQWLAITGNTTGQFDALNLTTSASSAGSEPSLLFGTVPGAVSTARISSTPGGAFTNSALTFWTADASKALQRRVTVNNVGNVGIGSTTPTYANLIVQKNYGNIAPFDLFNSVINGLRRECLN
jgi:hypothetical protein